MKKRMKVYHKSILVLLAAVVLGLSVAEIVAKDQSYSQIENRNLETFPKFSWEALQSGRFQKQFEDYIADQFVFRSGWIAAKTTTDRLMGKTESNGIFLAEDGYLIMDFTEPQEDAWNQTISAMESFADANPDLRQCALIAPTAVSVLEDKLPYLASVGDEDGFLNRVKQDCTEIGVEFIDVRSELQSVYENEEGQIYYRTDHHWTTFAAYHAYLVLARELQLSGKSVRYEPLLVSDTFQGTLSASSGFHMTEQDEIRIYEPEEEQVDYKVSYLEEQQTEYSFYSMDRLEQRNQYELFLKGNHPLVKIETSSNSCRRLLLFKDSYANCFVPFLVQDYEEIMMVDPRYYTGELSDLLATEEFTDVLYLYNANSFASDTGLYTVLTE